MRAEEIARKVSTQANANAEALAKAASQLKLAGGDENIIVEAEAKATAAGDQAEKYAKEGAAALLAVKKGEADSFDCNKNLGEAEKVFNYAVLMHKAAKSAAAIQIKAVCAAKKKTAEALWEATVEKRKLEDPVVTLLPGIQTIDIDQCIVEWEEFETKSNCNVALMTSPGSVTIRRADGDDLSFSWTMHHDG